MNICLVCREYPPESGVSGTGTYMYSISKGLEGLGHHITLVSYAKRRATVSREGNITIHRIRPKRLKGAGLLQSWIPVWFLNYSFAVREKLVDLNRRVRFDIIQMPEWGGEGFFYSLRPFCPFVVKVHGPLFLNHAYDKNPKTRILKRLENWMEKSVVQKANAVIFSSRAMRNVAGSTWKIELSNSTIIENPIDLAKFKPSKRPRRSPAQRPMVLYVGRLEYRKGVHVLVNALPEINKAFPDAVFWIIGSDTGTARGGGSILSETMEFLKKHNLMNSVKFIGLQKRENLIEYYQKCDLFVMPSLFEPVGFTAIEAMACGRPVAVSSNSGIAEWIKDGTSGFLIEPGDAGALADKIKYILRLDQSQREAIGATARDAVQKLSFENIAKKLERLYEKVIEQTLTSASLQ